MTSGPQELTIYRGSPLQIVESMAAEMSDDLSVREAINVLLAALTKNYRISIELPEGLNDEALARLFIYALLNTGVGRPLAKA